MASKAPKEIAKKAWTLFSQRFLIQANHTPYWDKPSEMAVRPGEPAVKPKVARGYPELEFNTAHYKRERGDVKVTPLLHEELVELAVDPRDPIAMPSHIPVPTWHEDAEGIMKMAALQSKGYAVVGVPYKASRAEYPIFGENSDFMFIDCDE